MHSLGLALLALATSTTTPAPPGASACSGCHGAGGPSRLEGRPAAEVVEAMRGFRNGTRPATVMDRIAKGFTEAETAAIADWLSRAPDARR